MGQTPWPPPLAAGNFSQQNEPTNSTSTAFLKQATLMLWLTVPPVLLVFGWFGNVMTIVVMRALRASDSTACLSVYFTALALSDLCLLTTTIVADWPEMALDVVVNQIHDAACAVIFFVIYVTSMTSAWFLMALTCQRMMSVMMPHRVGVICTVRRAKVLTAGMVTVACVSCAHIFFHYRVKELGETHSVCQHTDKASADVFFMLVLIVSSAIPSVFLLVANCVLIRGVQRSVRMSRVLSGRGDGHQPPTSSSSSSSSPSAKVSSMTLTLILTSVAFLVLSIPICVSDIYLEHVGFFRGKVQDGDLKAQLMLAETVALMMWLSNSAVNFYLYILSGRKFREETKRFLCLRFKK